MNLDTEVIMQVYDLVDMIKESKTVNDYLIYKKEIDSDKEVLSLKKKLAKERELYEEAQRFGHYHPSYGESIKRVEKVIEEINDNHIVKQYKKTENDMNDLLYLISSKIAGAISKSIIVANENNMAQESFCETGNCTSCGLKGQCAI